MSGAVCVFAGPTIDAADARAVLDAVYLPPARAGDVLRAVLYRRPAAIGIVDGLFDKVPSVWHKEVLFALSQGVHVYGSSSMGALRAAELHPFGMIGVGAIFDAYRSGDLEDDDEVAVAHGSAEFRYRTSSEAMVNIRHGLRLARDRGLIVAETEQRLAAAAKARFFADRSWPGLWEQGRALGVPSDELDRLHEFVRTERPNLKRDDALAMLTRIARDREAGLAPFSPDWDFEATNYFQRLVRDVAGAGGGEDGSDLRSDDLIDHVRLGDAREETLRGAVLLSLVESEARLLGLSVDDGQRRRCAEAFRRSRALTSAAATREWLDANEITDDEFETMVELEALLERVHLNRRQLVSRMVWLELKRTGAFARHKRLLLEKQRFLEERGTPHPTLADTGLTLSELIDWYQRRFRFIHTDLPAHTAELGFGSDAEFIAAVAGTYLFEHR